ncbi:MAG: SDR family oxidoreductase [Spirulina sp. SIO3F2]|nr:SDR family oxidoreductase [Spirulina sp. SIO3F2]
MTATFLEQLFGLSGRVALVTGASRGIGRAIAEGFVNSGATVFGIGRSPQPSAISFAYNSADICDRESIKQICNNIVHQYKQIDILVQAAGITLPSLGKSQSSQIFHQTLAVNLEAAYNVADIVSRNMKRGGTIIFVTSIAAHIGFPNNPGYVASKGGLRTLVRALAIDLAPHGIRVNALAPGYIHTAMTDASYANPVQYQARLNQTLLKRWGEPEDLVGAAIFLASSASNYVTGSDMLIDGGWTAKGL